MLRKPKVDKTKTVGGDLTLFFSVDLAWNLRRVQYWRQHRLPHKRHNVELLIFWFFIQTTVFLQSFVTISKRDFALGLQWNPGLSNPTTTYRNSGSITEWRLSSVHMWVICEQVLRSKGQRFKVTEPHGDCVQVRRARVSFSGPAS